MTTYRVNLTGAADELEDYDLSEYAIAFSGRLKEGLSSVTVELVDSDAIIDGIEARPNGTLQVYQVLKRWIIADQVWEQVAEALVTQGTPVVVDLDRSPTAARVTLSTSQTYANDHPATRSVGEPSGRRTSRGVRAFEAQPNLYLQPGDVADFGSCGSIVVKEIQYSVGTLSVKMTVTEESA